MLNRLSLQEALEEIVGEGHVYFQPPPSILMKYPCVKYDIESVENRYGDNVKYLLFEKYSFTLMDYDANSQYLDALNSMPYCRFLRKYKADQLNHFVFECYVTKE